MWIVLRAVASGLLVGLVAANVWPLLLTRLKMSAAVWAEVVFLALYAWWAAGGGPPKRFKTARGRRFRVRSLSGAEIFWGCIAAVSFAATIHAGMALLFRFVRFPAEMFHRGYDLSFVPSLPMKWIVCIVSALSAGVCEETGFRGYMQRPLEERYGPITAITVSSGLFMLIHLSKGWALASMVPIVLGAGVLLGVLARASGTLVFCMLGHWLMDIGLFSYWWAQIAGTFSQRPISETGFDGAFCLESAVFFIALLLFLIAVKRLSILKRIQPLSLSAVA
jgi:membrane protease YdiL (CAAX protease family)